MAAKIIIKPGCLFSNRFNVMSARLDTNEISDQSKSGYEL